jgi:hypothetical protein
MAGISAEVDEFYLFFAVAVGAHACAPSLWRLKNGVEGDRVFSVIPDELNVRFERIEEQSLPRSVPGMCYANVT